VQKQLDNVMKFTFFLAGLLALVACTDTAPLSQQAHKKSAPAKAAYSNARIYTLDDQSPWAETMVTEGADIIFVGSEDGARHYIDAETHIFDLSGQFVMPGLIDTHTHPGLVATLSEGDSEDDSEDDGDVGDNHLPKDSKESLYRFLHDYADEHPFKPFVMLVNSFLPEGPNKEELDKIFPWRPVILMDNSGHSTWANSMALWLLGVDKDTPDLSPGISEFARDQHGEPTGWIKEFAVMEQFGEFLVPPKAELREGLLSYLNFLSSRGVTTLWDAGNFSMHDDVYKVVAELDREGLLPLRYEGSYHVWDPKQIDTAVTEFKALREKYAGDRLQFNTLKIHYDGVNEILTAGMLEPYSTDPGNRGGVLFDAMRLSSFIEELNREGIHLHLHTVGDWATREALDAVELARKRINKPLSIEVTLSHLEIVSPEDIERFVELGVNANFTPHWFGGTVFGEAAATNLGAERASRSQVVNEFVQAGASVTLSSDVVSERESYRADPFMGMQMSVTRREYDNQQGPVLSPASASLSLENAMAAYTRNGASQLGVASRLGQLAEGMKADFVVLNQNPFELDIDRLYQVTPRATLLDGALVSGSLTEKQPRVASTNLPQ